MQGSYTRPKSSKYQLQHEMNSNMKWRIWITWWNIFCIRYSRLFWIYIKKAQRKIVDPSIRVYTNKIEKKIAFETKTRYYLGLLIPETMKLLGSTKSKITKNEDGKNVPFFRN